MLLVAFVCWLLGLFCFFLSLLVIVPMGIPAGASGCFEERLGTELFRWLAPSLLVCVEVSPDDCLLFFLEECSARGSKGIPSFFGEAFVLAGGGSAMRPPILLGEPGLWLLAGVDTSHILRLDDVVALGAGGKLPSDDQAVLTMGSKLLIPGTSGTVGLYCGKDSADTMELSKGTELVDWGPHGLLWNPVKPPPGPEAAGRPS